MLICLFVFNALNMIGFYPAFGKVLLLRSAKFIQGACLLLLLILGSANLISAQNNAVQAAGWGSLPTNTPQPKVETPKVGAEFPVFEDHGNPDQDIADYQQRKNAWIKANPDAYQRMLDGAAPKIQLIPVEDFRTMPQEKKDHILSNPDKYKVVKPASDKQ